MKRSKYTRKMYTRYVCILTAFFFLFLFLFFFSFSRSCIFMCLQVDFFSFNKLKSFSCVCRWTIHLTPSPTHHWWPMTWWHRYMRQMVCRWAFSQKQTRTKCARRVVPQTWETCLMLYPAFIQSSTLVPQPVCTPVPLLLKQVSRMFFSSRNDTII